METENSTCSVCSIQYDNKSHTPRILIDCGHTLCSQCLDKIIKTPSLQKCPFDNHAFNRTQNSLEQFPLNFALLALLEGKNQKICQVHSEELTIFCFQDNIKICSDCALFGEHKSHNIKKIKELKAKGSQVKKDLEESLIRFEKNQLEKNQDVENLKKRCLGKLENRFGDIKKTLKTKHIEWRKHLENLFERKMDNQDESLLKKEAEMALEGIGQACQKEDNLAILDRDFSSIISRLQPKVCKEEVSKLSQEASRMMDCLESFLASQANSLNKIDPEQPILKENEKQRNGFETINTMFTVEIFKESLLLWIKDPNRVDRIVHLGASRFIEKIRVTLEHYNSFFKGEADLNFLSYILQNLNNYTSLKVVFTPLDLNGHHALKLINILFCRIQYLTDIEICLKDCKIAIDEPMELFSNNILSKAISIRSLTLKLGSTSITDKGLFALARALSPFSKNLHTFALGAEHTVITDDGVEKVLYVIEKVKTLCLYLDGTGITDRSLKLLGEKKMPVMKNLEKFTLDASRTKITIEGVKAIFIGISKDISRLSLSFEGVKLSDEVISLFEEKVCPKLEFVEDVQVRLEGKDLRAKIFQILERVRKEGAERREARLLKQEKNHC